MCVRWFLFWKFLRGPMYLYIYPAWNFLSVWICLHSVVEILSIILPFIFTCISFLELPLWKLDLLNPSFIFLKFFLGFASPILLYILRSFSTIFHEIFLEVFFVFNFIVYSLFQNLFLVMISFFYCFPILIN